MHRRQGRPRLCNQTTLALSTACVANSATLRAVGKYAAFVYRIEHQCDICHRGPRIENHDPGRRFAWTRVGMTNAVPVANSRAAQTS